MAKVLASGPAPIRRGSRLGEILGAGLGSGFNRGFGKERETLDQVEQFNPVREALAAALDGQPALTPGQNVIKSMASDPRAFAKFMSDPQNIQSTAGATAMATPPRPEEVKSTRVATGEGDLNERFGLGIPKGQSARVEITRDPSSGRITNASVVSDPSGPPTEDKPASVVEFEYMKQNPEFAEFLEQSGPVQRVADESSPTGYRYVFRSEAAGQAAPGEGGGFFVEATPDGGVTVRVGGEQRTVPEGGGAVSGQEQREQRNAVRDAQDAISRASDILVSVTDTPGAVGLRGQITEAAGILSNLPIVGNALEQSVSQIVSGASPAEVQKVRSDLIAQVGSQLSAITGEESGRFTDRERQIAEETLNALQPTSSVTQALSAQKAIMRIQVMALSRALERQGASGLFDPADDESINRFGESLVGIGFSDQEALDILTSLLKQEDNVLLQGR